MKRKIVFFDLDGTLLNDQKLILDSTKWAIKMLRKGNIYPVIATGRSPQMIEWILKELHIDSYIALNGQYVVFKGKEIYSNPMSFKLLDEITELAKKNNHAIAYCGKGAIKVNKDRDDLAASSYKTLKLSYPSVDSDFYKHSEVFQGHLFCKAQEEYKYINKFPEFSFKRWHEFATDILPKGCSKKIGIQRLLEVTGVDYSNCYAFGDEINDIEMLSFIGTGIAMGNAIPEVKKIADYVTLSNNEDGILNGLLEKGLLERESINIPFSQSELPSRA